MDESNLSLSQNYRGLDFIFIHPLLLNNRSCFWSAHNYIYWYLLHNTSINVRTIKTVRCVLFPEGHGPFSHLFDIMFIPEIRGSGEWMLLLSHIINIPFMREFLLNSFSTHFYLKWLEEAFNSMCRRFYIFDFNLLFFVTKYLFVFIRFSVEGKN